MSLSANAVLLVLRPSMHTQCCVHADTPDILCILCANIMLNAVADAAAAAADNIRVLSLFYVCTPKTCSDANSARLWAKFCVVVASSLIFAAQRGEIDMQTSTPHSHTHTHTQSSTRRKLSTLTRSNRNRPSNTLFRLLLFFILVRLRLHHHSYIVSAFGKFTQFKSLI